MFKNVLIAIFLLGTLTTTVLGHTKNLGKLKENGTIIVFDELVKLLEDVNTLIVDVREPEELEETGQIPNSINVPLATVVHAFGEETPEEFKEAFNREKPDKSFRIVVYCKSGGRSPKAQASLEELGYTNVLNYAGGWLEWAEKYHPDQ